MMKGPTLKSNFFCWTGKQLTNVTWHVSFYSYLQFMFYNDRLWLKNDQEKRKFTFASFILNCQNRQKAKMLETDMPGHKGNIHVYKLNIYYNTNIHVYIKSIWEEYHASSVLEFMFIIISFTPILSHMCLLGHLGVIMELISPTLGNAQTERGLHEQTCSSKYTHLPMSHEFTAKFHYKMKFSCPVN